MTVEEMGTGVAPRESTVEQSSRMAWAHHAMANLYFHSPMPALTRRLRDRYRVAVSPAGGWRKLSFEKRTQPTARILYYHRVNDDNDPFFPAISTKLFEAEMQFVSKRYKVVSLAEMLRVLAGGSTEPVLAITFDDGYQDNYHQAFPILRRYGLPASIFLTTEPIDSREPLWFEQLALAVKKTAKNSIELEIDSPRRFWLRSQAEKLESIEGIFGLLREASDSDRRQWLSRILRQLAVEGDRDRNDKMLTWDQIRCMEKCRIDFGGHTVTHPFLSRMSGEQVTWEVSECKRRMEDELQLPVLHFAYPNGREKDFGSWNREVIRKAGYQAAVTTIWGQNYNSTDPMELRRGGPWETTPAAFAYKLDWYQLVDG
jgi:peptidoglycan/xylan/chitin deacetylase (PgdA/CDA1 family)